LAEEGSDRTEKLSPRMATRREETQTGLETERMSLRAIQMVSDAVHESLDLLSVAKNAVNAMMRYMHSPSVGLFLYSEGSSSLKLLYARGFSERILHAGSELPVERSLNGLVIRQKKIISCEDLSNDQRVELKVREELLKEGFTSVVSVPLLYQDRAIGAISLVFKGKYTLSEDERRTLLAIGKTIGLAIANAQHVARLEAEINERKRAEEEKERLQSQLLHAQKMEAIGRLAGGIAHDFNNMLTPIIGYANILCSHLSSDNRLFRYAKVIRDTAERAASLTAQLLAFSRRQTLKMEVLNLNLVISDMKEMLGRLIGEDIELTTLLDSELKLIKADKGQIEQVIMNLVLNARDAMPQGGKIMIKTGNIRVNEEYCKLHAEARPGDFVYLLVEDTGIGIDEEMVHRIFEPFFTTKERGKGTGLGLSVVYGIIKQHGGWINVYSEPGKGSTFKIYLPALLSEKEAKAGEEKVTPLEILQGGGERILIVEDSDAVREFAVNVLRDNGYRPFEARNVREAMELFSGEGGDFHLLFSDVILPDGTGQQLADELRSRKSDLKILLSSGYSDGESRCKIAMSEDFHFLQKPYSPAELLEAIKSALSS